MMITPERAPGLVGPPPGSVTPQAALNARTQMPIRQAPADNVNKTVRYTGRR